jgi:predicted nucleic acid-binding protein
MRILLDTSPLSQLAHPRQARELHAWALQQVMRRAAEMWADARRAGRPTAHPHALDIDVVIAAQAEMLGAVVATENEKHLALFVDARRWTEIL